MNTKQISHLIRDQPLYPIGTLLQINGDILVYIFQDLMW